MFESPEQVLSALNSVGYFADQKTATTVYLAGRINKPVMLEGPAGGGKTELAQAVARAAGADLIRLQCYQGINVCCPPSKGCRSMVNLPCGLLRNKCEGVSLLYHTGIFKRCRCRSTHLKILSVYRGFVWWPGQESNLRPSR